MSHEAIAEAIYERLAARGLVVADPAGKSAALAVLSAAVETCHREKTDVIVCVLSDARTHNANEANAARRMNQGSLAAFHDSRAALLETLIGQIRGEGPTPEQENEQTEEHRR